ncbi:isocitrate/isopropylmalate dehydrogenase family protein [Miltoncostaea marina]|uniref:isocitrate/isopropylmalate dehydrogenase family protein n=1 Tax=Miltoncostaea marina TaxID=2843215 RepID=UPI001C3DA722|nr:isocitrate/isopropylmalate family dehydrogenase [Miltoncostaea marina]
MSAPHRVTLIPGDGIGPEVVGATRRVLEATGVAFDWDVQAVGEGPLEALGTPLPDAVPASVIANRVALKGPVTAPKVKGFRSVNIGLRRASGMFGNVRPCRSYPGVRSRYEDVDVVVVRDVSEDLYAGVEAFAGSPEAEALVAALRDVLGVTIADGSGLTIKAISEAASRRIVEYAFDFARRSGRTRVTAVHKAPVMKATDGLFLEVAREVAAANPDIAFDDRAVDIICTQLVQRPQEFQVLVMPMQYGDILSDLCAGLVGGAGMIPGVNVGTDAVLFEPGHGSAPHLAGTDRANPMATMLSGVLMLRHLGEADAADRLEGAIAAVLAEGRHLTYDQRPRRDDPAAARTSEVADAVARRLEAGAPVAAR